MKPDISINTISAYSVGEQDSIPHRYNDVSLYSLTLMFQPS
jgi:hypothetical protein